MKKLFISFAFSLLLCAAAGAQELSTGYFLENYMHANKINPALQPCDATTGFLALTPIGGVTVAPQSNLGLGSFFFPKNGMLVNGFNNLVSKEEFLSKFSDINRANASVSLNLLGFGFRAKKSFVSIELNVKSLNSVTVPKSALALAKSGSDQSFYTIGDISVMSRSYAELAVNYSRKFGSRNQFSVGATLKGLFGLASADVKLNTLAVDFSDKTMTGVVASGQADLSASFISFEKENGKVNLTKPNFDYMNFIKQPSAFGFAADLGFHWDTPLKGLSADVAVLNLGGLAWGQNYSGGLDVDTVVPAGKFDDILNSLTSKLEITENATPKKVFQMLPTTINAGAKYRMPFYDRLSAGILGSFTFGDLKYQDIRLGVDVTPVDCIGIAVSGGYTSMGWVMGTAINFRFPVINIYAGIDGIPTSYGAFMIPVSQLNTVAKVGLIFTFGKIKTDLKPVGRKAREAVAKAE